MSPVEAKGPIRSVTATVVSDLEHHFTVSDTSPNQLPPLPQTTSSRVLWKIDRRVVPCVATLALMCFLDRANMGNALVYGMREDLGLTGAQFSTALTMFFITYIVFEIPWNILLKKLTPRIWLSFNAFVFGIVTLCTGFVQNYSSLLALRLLLGLAEAGVFPGCTYLMSSWYTRPEAQRRFSLYLSAVNFSSAFGGLLAGAIGKMDGVGGLAGWRWIFILGGILTCLVALLFFLIMPDFPEQVGWLSSEEREFVQARLRAEQGPSAIELGIRFRDVYTTVRDPKVLMAGLIHMSASVPGYMGAYFAPMIVQSLGIYSSIQTQLHTVPVWIVTTALTLAVAYVSDVMRHRYAVALACALLSVVGYLVMFEVRDNVRVRYGALFLAMAGVPSMMPVEICWNMMNLGGHRRRAIGSAWQVAFGNFGGIIGSYAFRAQDGPGYQFSYAICIGFCCLTIIWCTLYAGYCWWVNRRRAARGWGREFTEAEKAQMGDLSPAYRLMI